MRELFRSVPLDRKVAAFTLGIVALTVIGPFGTAEDLDLAQRLVFWIVVLTGVGFFMHVFITCILDLDVLAPLPRLVRIALGVAVAALPGAAVVVFVDAVFRPPVMEAGQIWRLWAQVAVIGMIFGMLEFTDWSPAGPLDGSDGSTVTALHRRLPPELGRDIVSLSMNDHYVEITTTEGAHMELMRMSDAVNESRGLEGLRIHRSHWVARAHLCALERQQGKNRVVLSDGRTLPVSATYLDAVRAAVPVTA